MFYNKKLQFKFKVCQKEIENSEEGHNGNVEHLEHSVLILRFLMIVR